MTHAAVPGRSKAVWLVPLVAALLGGAGFAGWRFFLRRTEATGEPPPVVYTMEDVSVEDVKEVPLEATDSNGEPANYVVPTGNRLLVVEITVPTGAHSTGTMKKPKLEKTPDGGFRTVMSDEVMASYRVDPRDFTLYDGAGASISSGFASRLPDDARFRMGDFVWFGPPPPGRIRIHIAFDVPEGATPRKIKFRDAAVAHLK